jgi:hypothetical protein
MARRMMFVVALCLLAAALPAPPALAHAGDPHYESLVEGVTPRISGFSVAVLNGDDRLEVVNHSSRTITIDGYDKEPYLLMQPDGTVSVNLRSPAHYLNGTPTGTAPIPTSADPQAIPRWRVVERNGRYQFHDHRIHWMAKGAPQQVKDRSVRTKVVDWRVPLHAGTTDGAIDGTLFWRGSAGGPPAGAFAALAVLVLLGVAAVVVVRRRRRAGAGGGAGAGQAPEEAW